MLAIIADCVHTDVEKCLILASFLWNIAADPGLRTKMFGYLSATSQALLLLGPIIASSTMSISLWFPLWTGVAVSLLAGLTVAILPDTRQLHHVGSQAKQNRQEPTETDALLERNRRDEDGEAQHLQEQGLAGVIRVVKGKLRTKAQNWKLLLEAPRNFKLSLLALLVSRLGASNTLILPQYISIRYGWTFTQVKSRRRTFNQRLELSLGWLFVVRESSDPAPGVSRRITCRSQISH